MSTFVKILNWFISVMKMSFSIYGYYISFWQIFVFTFIAIVSSILIHAIISR